MKRSDIEIGGRYTAKVSGQIVAVRITRDRGMNVRPWASSDPYAAKEMHGGWDAINVATGRAIHIKTAARMRGKA